MKKINFINPGSTITITAQDSSLPERLDSFLTRFFADQSRNFFQQLITKDSVLVNGIIITKYNYLVKLHDRIEITFPADRPEVHEFPNDLGIRVVYENPNFLIIYKPPHLVVHAPTPAYTSITLVDWLTTHFKELKDVGVSGRSGIVHRLDKETSGILIVPRNNHAHKIFTDLFKNRRIEKNYFAVVQGHPPAEGMIDFTITRHPVHKHKMTHKQLAGRESLTYYNVEQYLNQSALVTVRPVTGRTHQIRVHFSAIGHPIIGDKVYGCPSQLIDRQALHAYRLAFEFLGHFYIFWYGMPSDMITLIQKLTHNQEQLD